MSKRKFNANFRYICAHEILNISKANISCGRTFHNASLVGIHVIKKTC